MKPVLYWTPVLCLVLGVSGWGQTGTAVTCPDGKTPTNIQMSTTDLGSYKWQCGDKLYAMSSDGHYAQRDPQEPQNSSNAPLTNWNQSTAAQKDKPSLILSPRWQQEYDTFKNNCERSRGTVEKLDTIGFTCHYVPSQHFHNCQYRSGSSNNPNGQDTSEVYSCDEAVIEVHGKWSQTIEHGVLYKTQLGRSDGKPRVASHFDKTFFKWCATPHDWDLQQKEMCGWADDPPKPSVLKPCDPLCRGEKCTPCVMSSKPKAVKP